MKYEFHVGDYVETKEGVIGYISSIRATGDAWWMCVSDCHGYQAGQQYSIMHNGDFLDHYNRIGQYEFIEGKIKPLSYTEQNLIHTSSEKILHDYMKKINELVDAVNELRDRNNLE